MKRDVFLLYLDRYHQGDPLFVKQLAEGLSGVQQGGRLLRCMIVHGSGEKAERTLEAQGVFAERKGGVLQVEAPAHRQLVERAAREANQELVAALTDAVVSAVGAQGTDRRLLRPCADGAVEAGALGWVEDLMAMRVVPVLSALARDAEGRARATPPVEAALAVAGAIDEAEATLVSSTRNGKPGLRPADGPRSEASASEIPASAAPEPEAVRRAAGAGCAVLLTSLDGFFAEEGPRGTHLTA